MQNSPSKTMEKLIEVLNAWKEIAPDEIFGGMTLAQFETEINKSMQARVDITDIENQLTNRKKQRDLIDQANWEKMQLVVDSVKGNPNYGKNSGLYQTMGYVTNDERKSGLTRKKKDNGGENK